MTRSLKQLGFSLPPGSFYSNALRVLFVSPNSPLSLNCWIFSTLTSGVCDLSLAKPLFLKSLLWTLFFPSLLALNKTLFLISFSSLLSFSWFHSGLYRFYTHDSQIYIFIRTSFPQSRRVCLSDFVSSSFSVFFCISSASTTLWVIICLPKYSHFIFALSLTLCSHDCWRDLLKSWVKSCHSPAQKSCLDSPFQPKYDIHVIAFSPLTTLLTSLPLSLQIGHSLLCKNSRV